MIETETIPELGAEVIPSMDDNQCVHIWDWDAENQEIAICGATESNNPECRNADGTWPLVGDGVTACPKCNRPACTFCLLLISTSPHER